MKIVEGYLNEPGPILVNLFTLGELGGEVFVSIGEGADIVTNRGGLNISYLGPMA